MASQTILVVDDAPTERRLLGGWLAKHGGFVVDYATDGNEALEWLRMHKADLVLTDMQMPNMNGLQLVTVMRNDYPRTPVILITAHGSEDLASQALQRGAAGYVPKARFQEMLVSTVNRVLELSRVDDAWAQSFQLADLCEVHFWLPNDPDRVGPLVETIQTIVGSVGTCDAAGQLHVGIALEQAILNAIYHGNLELNSADCRDVNDDDLESLVVLRREESPFCDRRVHIQVRITGDEARFVVRDDGPGFDVQNLIKIPISTSLVDPSGRGFVLMWALVDRVVFNKTGNQVTLIKRRDQPHAAPSTEGPAEVRTETPPSAPQKKAEPPTGDLGRLSPVGGGKPILLERRRVVIGRDAGCDIVLRDPRVSRRHCVLLVYSGWWYVKSLTKSNVLRVNRTIVNNSRLPPGSILSLADHDFEISYDPTALGAVGITPPVDPF